MAIRSMTGYGNSTVESDNFTLSIEVKSLNSKFLELTLKTPRDYNDKELEIRNTVTNSLERGKVLVVIERINKGSVKPKVQVNLPLFTSYYNMLKEAADTVGATTSDELFKIAFSLPDATTSEISNSSNEGEQQLLTQGLQIALDNCNKFREDEGAVLAQKLQEYIETIATLLNKVEEADPQRILQTRTRIRERLQELALDTPIDNNRFEQELIYYIEKLDINEEKVRLRSHLNYFSEALQSGNGKKLGFISQEIGREINTIGSKVNDAVIQRWVVEMKEELEKIKEQSLNVM